MKLSSFQFTPTQAAGYLVLIIVLRMFGLFIAIPVLSIHATSLLDFAALSRDHGLTANQSGFWLGLVMGGYGLMQFLLQIPSGLLSDRFGRKPIIFYGLIFFIIGALICELARSVEWLAVGRMMQGVGTVSAASTALLADLTTAKNRVRWMALMGVGISLAFIGGFVVGPKLYGLLHFQGFFLISAYLAVFSITLLSFFPSVPAALSAKSENKDASDSANTNGATSHFPPTWQSQLRHALKHPQLMPLNAGVFFLHASMVGVFVAVPSMLAHFMGLQPEQQWHFYGWVVPLTLIGAMVYIWPTQKTLRLKSNADDSTLGKSLLEKPPSAIPLMVALLLLSLWGISLDVSAPTVIIIGMAGFFFAFNVLEAMQPALVSFVAPLESKGTAMGVYHACQSLGLFVGGLCSAWIFRVYDASTVFRFNAALIALWLAFALFAYFQLEKEAH